MDPILQLKLRRMAPADLDAVVALDAAITGHTRRTYFERRVPPARGPPRPRPPVGAGGGGAGPGPALPRARGEAARKLSITESHTAGAWRNHAMLRFLDGIGYQLAPSQIIECGLHDNPALARAATVTSPSRDKPGDPNDWSAPAANDFEQLARDAADVRLLTAKDLEEVVRIDRHITGRH